MGTRFASFDPADLAGFQVSPHVRLGDAPSVAEIVAREPSWTARDESGQVIACFGIVSAPAPTAWALFSPQIKAHLRALLRFIRRDLFETYARRRIEAHVFPDHPGAAKFAEACGLCFERQFEVHPSGVSGVALFAREAS